MKNAFIFFLLSVCISAQAQKQLEYTEVVKVDSTASKAELIKRATIWFDQTFNNPDRVIQIKDEDQGQFVGSASMNYDSKIYIGSAATHGIIKFQIKILLKDGRYKYQFSDFYHQGDMPVGTWGYLTDEKENPRHIKGQPKGWEQKVWDDIHAQLGTKLAVIIASLKEAMDKPTGIEDENDDW